jgi:Protein of unknown function (DUF3300)
MNPVIRASTAFLLSAVVSSTSVMTGCNSAKPNAAAAQGGTQPAGPAQSVPTNSPPPQMSLDDVVAPIALYPDQLLAQILTASTNAQEVLDGGNWLLQNQSLKGDALTNAAKQAGFSPSMQYLMTFPQVVDNMCQQVDWTRELGQDFQADQKGVMDAVQRKRAQAQQTGNLKSSPQMTVDTKQADNGQSYVEIKPADPQVVYVPQYNPVTIYNTPAPASPVTTTTTEQAQSGVSTGSAVAIGLLSFGVGMAVGSAMHRDDYYPYPSWGYRGVYYGGRPYYPPPYRPAYAGYRPAYGYHPPPNYHWNQYNRQVNVNVNNNNYYGRYNSNTVRNNGNVNNRPGLGGGNQGLAANNNRPGQPNWKGQSTYQGARPNPANQRPGAAMANANPRNQQLANRPTPGNNVALANRPSLGNNPAAANRPNLGPSPGANAINRPAAANAASINRPNNLGSAGPINRAAAAPPNMNRGGDRGFGNSGARPGGAASPVARPAPQQVAAAQNRAGAGNSAFNRGGSPKAERAASNRGQASMGGGRGGGPRGKR